MQTSDNNSQLSNPYQQDEQSQDFDKFLCSLPREKGWWSPYLYNYQGFWYDARYLRGVVASQQHFEARDTDIFLITSPKSGTTWLKALLFALLNRNQYPITQQHPLFTQNPHDLVPYFEFSANPDKKIPDFSTYANPRLISTHLPLISLPKSILDSKCKLVYLCRNPKDNFVSNWHFANNINKERSRESISLEEAFEMFSRGVAVYGPCWDHVLGYWDASCEHPEKILFLKYEELKEQPLFHLRRLAAFLEFPFSAEEEASGLDEEILRLCSLDNMRNMDVNKRAGNMRFFRKGEVGDWQNLLSLDMVDKLDSITKQKFQGSNLKL